MGGNKRMLCIKITRYNFFLQCTFFLDRYRRFTRSILYRSKHGEPVLWIWCHQNATSYSCDQVTAVHSLFNKQHQHNTKIANSWHCYPFRLDSELSQFTVNQGKKNKMVKPYRIIPLTFTDDCGDRVAHTVSYFVIILLYLVSAASDKFQVFFKYVYRKTLTININKMVKPYRNSIASKPVVISVW